MIRGTVTIIHEKLPYDGILSIYGKKIRENDV